MEKKMKNVKLVLVSLILVFCIQICMADEWDITVGANQQFAFEQIDTPQLEEIDDNSYLCVYYVSDYMNWVFCGKAVVLTYEPDSGLILAGLEIEFADGMKNFALKKIDDTHYLCSYRTSDLFQCAVILTVDLNSYTVTSSAVSLSGMVATECDLMKLDDEHYLLATGSLGEACVLTVDIQAETVSFGSVLTFANSEASNPTLEQIDETHFLCSYWGAGSVFGKAVILSVDQTSWTVDSTIPYEFATGNGAVPDIAKIDDTHYLCTYGNNPPNISQGFARVLTIDQTNWTISAETEYLFESWNATNFELLKLDNTHFMCAFSNCVGEVNGKVVVLTVDPATWEITAGSSVIYDEIESERPFLAEFDEDTFICVYSQGGMNGGFAVNIDLELPASMGTVEGQVIELAGMYPIPIEGAEIYNGTELLATSNETGHFTFEIEAGTYMFNCVAEGYEDLTEEVVVIAGEITSHAFIMTSTTGADDNIIPSGTVLKGNFPNPFNPETTISFSNHKPGHVIVEIYNTKGQKVKTLVNEHLAASNHSVVWQGDDDTGESVSSGIYFYKMNSGIYSSTRKMILMK
ncbi:MAG: T9SS type A sorting domain-containing protein [Candidatus Cloacimonetes bacterium]|nr:T9SS type A sorting domain-containing protein [Candidatus Cloacimonadota bacterium]